MNIKISKLKKENIFTSDYDELTDNNTIEFSGCKIAVVYAPNGGGKTTLSKILGNEGNTEFSVEYNSKIITNNDEEKIFHIIEDQNGRNVIKGKTEDFIMGHKIKQEYELKAKLEKEFAELYNKELIPVLKNQFGISKKSGLLYDKIAQKELANIISDLSNVKSKGKGFERSQFIDLIKTLSKNEIGEISENKYKFLISDYSKEKSSIISQISKLVEDDIRVNQSIRKIEENDDAISILEKYDYINDCIVCDNKIKRQKLLDQKKISKTNHINSLDDKTKFILEKIISAITNIDPFNIKSTMLNTIKGGDFSKIVELKQEFDLYFDVYNRKLNNYFSECLNNNEIITNFKEYNALLKEKPKLTEGDIIFIEKFLNDCIGKKIELKRDDDNNLDLLLGNRKLLNEDRKNLSLSNGEQNFISLAFELLKAKNTECPVIILDDPISSFDSIYKNKIAYSIIKFLENKYQLILTHSTELIRLMEHQRLGCFNLYFLNNTEGEINGFIRASKDEQELVLYLHKLINFFRSSVSEEIINEKNFVISVIPFMRGYAQITNKTELKDRLTKLMHGYESEEDNITEIYNELFETEIIKQQNITSALEISNMNVSNLEILNVEKFPLLNKTLVHTFTYLFLRLNVEKELVNKFQINTKKNYMLNQIIIKSFDNSTQENIEKRMFLLSRKTLLNEFNHFEVDMNIFQPAIDITNTALKKEKEDIIEFLDNI